MIITLTDNGGRRLEGDRRLLVEENYSPERRSGLDRRVEGDRRKEKKQSGTTSERRTIYELLSA
ncbi:MAG: hypothetical protein KKD44_20425 [Proteobacteria bacterium]|nr:hypothetical protein [Pseudomonadota bacterium]